MRGRGRLSRSIPLLLLLLIALPGCQDGEKEQGKEAAAKPTPVRVLNSKDVPFWPRLVVIKMTPFAPREP